MIHVQFDQGKIGRKYGVADQWFATKKGGGDLPYAMFSFVGKHLASKDYEVITYADGTGAVKVGGTRTVATFTWKEQTDAEDPGDV